MSPSETTIAFFCFCCGISIGILFTAFAIFLHSTFSSGRRAVEATNAECDASGALDPIRIAVARGDKNSQLAEDTQKKIRDWIIGRINFKATHPWAVHTNPFEGIELRLKSQKRGGKCGTNKLE